MANSPENSDSAIDDQITIKPIRVGNSYALRPEREWKTFLEYSLCAFASVFIRNVVYMGTLSATLRQKSQRSLN